MGTVALISCVKKKGNHPAKAKDLYTSTLFRSGYRYALSLNPSAIFILSAKYHLLNPETVIEPYEHTLNTIRKSEIVDWSEKVLKQLREVSDLKQDNFIFLAGERYRKYLVPHISNYKIPMQGLPLGKQMAWLKRMVSV